MKYSPRNNRSGGGYKGGKPSSSSRKNLNRSSYATRKQGGKSFGKKGADAPAPVVKARGPKPIPKTTLFPMRVNKYLAQEGFATRRDADKLIEKRWVTINGRVAILGDKVNEGDAVEVKHNKKPDTYKYFAYNKPKGTPMEQIDVPPELSPILGLDTQAEGLVLFSTDRRPIDRLASTKYLHEKEYYIKTHNNLRPNFKEKMEQGVIIKGADPISTHVKIKDDREFILKTADNGSHIRHMCSMFNAEIASLMRIRALNIELKGLQPGQNRELDEEEVQEFLKKLGL